MDILKFFNVGSGCVGFDHDQNKFIMFETEDAYVEMQREEMEDA